jgi:UDP-2,3-diacylglucosamine pyrophosphatase LpxH
MGIQRFAKVNEQEGVMRVYRFAILVLIIGMAVLSVNISALAAGQQLRPIYVISDLHMGVGKIDGKDWDLLEDFRWPRALDAFLAQIAKENKDGVDLVIAGDLLDLLQHPTIPCGKSKDPNCGCSIEEMKQITTDVLAGHKTEFVSIGVFLSSGLNRVFVMPGNHDAALMKDEIWALVARAVPQGRDRFIRVTSETWFSSDNKVAIEHGHQHRFDINAFPEWPKSVTRKCADGERLFRPWGENFMEDLYNDVERKLVLIDNFVPDSRGISIYYRYTKQEGTTLEEIARFAIFNVLQTSWYQKLTLLDLKKERRGLSKNDLDFCRRCMGEDLILRSLEGQGYNSLARISDPEQKKQFRLALRKNVASLDDDAVIELCERVVEANDGRLEPNLELKMEEGCGEPLAMAAEMVFDRNGSHVLEKIVSKLNEQKPALLFYIFGHTHEAKIEMQVQVGMGTSVSAFNSGAFQRLMDKDFFEKNLKDGESEVDAMARLIHGDMKACYHTLAITYDKEDNPHVALRQWYKTEDPLDDGRFHDDCTPDCSARPANCLQQRRP